VDATVVVLSVDTQDRKISQLPHGIPVAVSRAMIVEELMTPDPVTATPETSVAEVWDRMREAEIRHVPVLDRGALVGIVSDRDFAHLDLASMLRREGAEAFRDELARPVVEVMSADVIAVAPDSHVSHAVALLIEHRVGALPVVRPETRQLVGILSYVDVLRACQGVLADEP
jgi:acetoin utilization protein AcuB